MTITRMISRLVMWSTRVPVITAVRLYSREVSSSRRDVDAISTAVGVGGMLTMVIMTRETERAYVKRWVETGRVLEEIRWRELRGLDDARALKASADLIEAALRTPLPPGRRRWSG